MVAYKIKSAYKPTGPLDWSLFQSLKHEVTRTIFTPTWMGSSQHQICRYSIIYTAGWNTTQCPQPRLWNPDCLFWRQVASSCNIPVLPQLAILVVIVIENAFKLLIQSRDGTEVKLMSVLPSCDFGSGLSLLTALVLSPSFFQAITFSSPHKNQHSKF